MIVTTISTNVAFVRCSNQAGIIDLISIYRTALGPGFSGTLRGSSILQRAAISILLL